jgi:hypothetical protein
MIEGGKPRHYLVGRGLRWHLTKQVATSGMSVAHLALGSLLCSGEDLSGIGVRLRSLMGGHVPPPRHEMISGEDEVGTPSRDGDARWGGGSCVDDRAGEEGRYQAAVAADTASWLWSKASRR